MPTRNRRAFVPRALEQFARQDYPRRELIIVDDGNDPIGDLLPPEGGPAPVRYIRLEGVRRLGFKRNLACRQASGSVILHWDDDDWMADWRISYQVQALLDEKADVCGLSRMVFYDPNQDKAWEYVYPPEARSWVAGGSLCYTRRFWESNPFPDLTIGEDTRFLWDGRAAHILPLADNTFYVAWIHPGNTNTKNTRDPRWQNYPVGSVHRLLNTDAKVVNYSSDPAQTDPDRPDFDQEVGLGVR